MTSSFDQFLTNLENFFAGAAKEVEAVAAGLVPKLENLVEVALEDLAAFAGRAVLDEASKVISGKEKFGNAVTNVVQSVEAQGKTVAIQTAQTAVQTAFLTAQEIVTKK